TYSPCSSRYSDSLSNAASADSGVNCCVPSHSEYSKLGIGSILANARLRSQCLGTSRKRKRRFGMLLSFRLAPSLTLPARNVDWHRRPTYKSSWNARQSPRAVVPTLETPAMSERTTRARVNRSAVNSQLGAAIDQPRIARAVREILLAVGEDP